MWMGYVAVQINMTLHPFPVCLLFVVPQHYRGPKRATATGWNVRQGLAQWSGNGPILSLRHVFSFCLHSVHLQWISLTLHQLPIIQTSCLDLFSMAIALLLPTSWTFCRYNFASRWYYLVLVDQLRCKFSEWGRTGNCLYVLLHFFLVGHPICPFTRLFWLWYPNPPNAVLTTWSYGEVLWCCGDIGRVTIAHQPEVLSFTSLKCWNAYPYIHWTSQSLSSAFQGQLRSPEIPYSLQKVVFSNSLTFWASHMIDSYH